MKKSKNEYEEAVKKSFSIAGVCRYFNIKPCGGNYKTIHEAIESYNLDISHFTGQGWNKGLQFRPNKPKDINNILTINSYYKTDKLKKRLFECGLKKEQCEVCGLAEWNNQKIPLELHHINGKNSDNRIDNLQILCPNCHALTNNYRGKNKGKNEDKKNIKYEIIKPILKKAKEEKKPHFCEYCSKELKGRQYRNKYCSQECAHNAISKRPNVMELIESFKKLKNYTQVGKYYGVSDKAVKKWVILYKIENLLNNI